MTQPTYFRGSPLQFFDAVEFMTKVDTTLGGGRFACVENSMNPRQLDFTSPKLSDWKLARVAVGGESTYSHAYLLSGASGILLNCFRGEPIGISRLSAPHVLWWIKGMHIDCVERTVKKKMMSAAQKVTEISLQVRPSHPDAPPVPLAVSIDALDNADDARFADHLVAAAAAARGVATPAWPDGVGVQRLDFGPVPG